MLADAGSYLGACKVIDRAVAANALTQDQANVLIRSIAGEIAVRTEEKDRIAQRLQRPNQPASPCATAIRAL